MNIRREIADSSRDAPVQRTAVREMPAEAHARRADAAGTGWEVQEGGDGEGGVFVVGGEFLFFVTSFSFGEAKPRQPLTGSAERRGKGVRAVTSTFCTLSALPLSVPGPS